MTGVTAHYSFTDRLLHKWAFGGIEIQKSLADIEDRMHAADMSSIAIERPIFITALPRAGTTLLLDLVASDPNFVTHTYRCMPFVLCPILWNSISRGFQRPSEAKERAHGDGMMVGYDSPEAFEEVLWKAFWPKKYHPGHIDLWNETDRNGEFEQFLRNHLKKLILLRAAPGRKGMRYVSKNNANIARTGLLNRIFPDATFVVPFRNPVDHAGSLLRQHKRFVEIHGAEPFTRYYMESVGHSEFGAELRVIDFPPTGAAEPPADPMTGNFWLAYWIRAYSHLLNDPRSNLHFVDFDRLCAEPGESLEALQSVIGMPGFSAQSHKDRFHAAVRYDRSALDLDPGAVQQSEALLGRLSARAIR